MTKAGRSFFRGQTATRGVMNKTEADYASRFLAVREAAGEVLWWRHEAIKLRVTDKLNGRQTSWYTADFAAMRSDGTMELHEVKGGFETEKDILRLKCAASLYPFVFVFAVKRSKKRGGWNVTMLKGDD